jgi:hypothetical protein
LRHYATFAIIFSIITSLIISSNSALALTTDDRYNSGYNHGCSDGKQGGHYYLSGSGGAANHTPIFMQGYNEGYRSCSSSVGSTSTSSPNPVKQDFRYVCQSIQNYLLNSCSIYVYPNGGLTTEGLRAHNCIIGGGLLSGAGILYNLPPLIIIGILEPLSQSTNCGGIVNWSLLRTDVAGASVFLNVLGIG